MKNQTTLNIKATASQDKNEPVSGPFTLTFKHREALPIFKEFLLNINSDMESLTTQEEVGHVLKKVTDLFVAGQIDDITCRLVLAMLKHTLPGTIPNYDESQFIPKYAANRYVGRKRLNILQQYLDTAVIDSAKKKDGGSK